MPDTNFDNVRVAGGLVVAPGASFIDLSGNGTTYYVDPDAGSSSYNGLSWATAKATMAQAFALLNSGDTVYFRGKIREQITTPVQVFDVTIIGAGNRPRHADAEPAPTGGHGTNTWTTPVSAAATTPLCKVLQQGWRFVNILFAGPTDAACVLLFRDGGAANAERDASHAHFYGCRFASGQTHIEQSGGCYNVRIENCSFASATGQALKSTAGAGIAIVQEWEILNNRFYQNANNAVFAMQRFRWIGNTFTSTTTGVLNTDGGDASAGHNIILNNAFDIAAADFDPAGGVTGDATDLWSNYLKDAIETGLPAN
jgi:hypothetical protein